MHASTRPQSGPGRAAGDSLPPASITREEFLAAVAPLVEILEFDDPTKIRHMELPGDSIEVTVYQTDDEGLFVGVDGGFATTSHTIRIVER